MRTRALVGMAVGVTMALAAAGASGQEASKEPKGMTTRGLVTSLGGFSATTGQPVLLTGSTVELPSGGETGRQQFRVPTYVYVVEGVLTTEYESGPVGIAGVQYHAAGQSFMDNGGWWHNHFNRGAKPVKYVILHVGYPGRPDPILKPEKED